MSKREDFRADLVNNNGFNQDQIEEAMAIYDQHFPIHEVGDLIVYTGEGHSIVIGECMEYPDGRVGLVDFSIDIKDCRRANADEIEVYERRNA